MPSFTLNGNPVSVAADDKPLLWVLREDLDLMGTKYGCGIAQCGACRVLVDGRAEFACQLWPSDLEGRQVVTIEGLAGPDGRLSIVQAAWEAEQVPQCGYCQPGFLVAATALLATTPAPTDAQIDAALTHICRCGTHPRIRRAVHRAAAALTQG